MNEDRTKERSSPSVATPLPREHAEGNGANPATLPWKPRYRVRLREHSVGIRRTYSPSYAPYSPVSSVYFLFLFARKKI